MLFILLFFSFIYYCSLIVNCSFNLFIPLVAFYHLVYYNLFPCFVLVIVFIPYYIYSNYFIYNNSKYNNSLYSLVPLNSFFFTNSFILFSSFHLNYLNSKLYLNPFGYSYKFSYNLFLSPLLTNVYFLYYFSSLVSSLAWPQAKGQLSYYNFLFYYNSFISYFLKCSFSYILLNNSLIIKSHYYLFPCLISSNEHYLNYCFNIKYSFSNYCYVTIVGLNIISISFSLIVLSYC